MTGKKKADLAEAFIYDVFRLVRSVFSCFFVGIYELRKKSKFIAFLVAAAIAVVLFVLLRPNRYAVCSAALPAMVLFSLGVRKRSIQNEYQKSFEEIGFKGKNGHVPRWVDGNETKGKTTAYFKSNIPLSAWKKSTESLQTTFDCKILSIEQTRSKKVTKLVYVSADHDIGDIVPWKHDYISKITSEIVLGESIYSQIKFNFNITPHWIIAGSTGSGKSVLLRLIVYQCIVKYFRVILMDFKRGVEFGRIYDRFCEVIMEKKRAVEILQSLVQENKRRLDLFRENGIENLEGYNKRFKHDPLERIVVFIDELAILLIPTRDKEDKELSSLATDCLENLAILGRAAGINLVFGIQRPDANTVSGQIKSNVTGRVCGYFSDTAPSLIVLNNTKATEIPSKIKGRFMFQDGEETVEFQGYYLNAAEEIAKLPDREPLEPEPDEGEMEPALARMVAAPLKAGRKRNLALVTDYRDC